MNNVTRHMHDAPPPKGVGRYLPFIAAVVTFLSLLYVWISFWMPLALRSMASALSNLTVSPTTADPASAVIQVIGILVGFTLALAAPAYLTPAAMQLSSAIIRYGLRGRVNKG